MKPISNNTSPSKRIFPASSTAKRTAVLGVRVAGRITKSTTSSLLPAETEKPRLLIQSMGGIGNTLMATPLIAKARVAFPKAQIDLLTSPGAAKLLAANRHLTNCISDPNPSGLYALQMQLRSARYDAVMVALNSHQLKYAVRVVLANVPRRLMHTYQFELHDDFTSAFTHVLPRPIGRHDSQCNVDLLSVLTGTEYSAGPMEIDLPSSAIEQAKNSLQHLGWREEIQSIGLCTGSSGWMSFKRWPLDHAIRAVELFLNGNLQMNVVVICGPEEVNDAIVWKRRFSSTNVQVIENVDLPEMAGVIRHLHVLIANDNLGMHIAAAQSVPVVALFGPTDPARTGPWKCKSEVLTAPGRIPYFELPYPPDPSQFENYMAEITPDRVVRSVIDLLTQSGPTTAPN